jgi:SAM-dependent methyltransferase
VKLHQYPLIPRMNVQKLKRVVPRPLWPYLGAVRRWVRSVPPRPLLSKKRLLSDPSLSERERELLGKVSSKIYFQDGMYNEDGAHYFKVGLSAIQCIDEAMERAKSTAKLRDPRTILDLPCGSGRVLRFLSVRFPEARITACDIQRRAVDFCGKRLGADTAYSSANLNEVSLDKKFDLIFCGSLITHLDQAPIIELLQFFKRHLNSDGLLIFTTHGDYVAARLPKKEFDYGLEDQQMPPLLGDYARDGFGYAGYPQGVYDVVSDFGVSLTSRDWIHTQVRIVGGLREVYFKERGWDNHQDVFGFVREVNS